MSPASIALLSGRFLFGKRGTGGASVAKRSLRGAILGIACSLVPLVIVIELADGMIEGIMSRFIELGSYHAQIIPEKRRTAAELLQAAEEAKGLPGVLDAYAEMQCAGVAISGAERSGASVRAVEPRLFEDDLAFKKLLTVKEGKLSLPGRTSAVVGAALAKKLGLKAGDRVNLLTLRSSGSGAIVPRLTPFRVEAIVSSGYQELDSLWFFIPLLEGYRILPYDNSVALVGLSLPSVESPSAFGSEPASYARVEENVPAGSSFHPWYRLLESQYQSLLMTKMWLYLITGMIVLVACVNVYQAVVMLVIERRQEIAILKSMGASPGGITLSFTLAGAFIGFTAMVFGMAAGIFFAVNVNQAISASEWIVNSMRSLDSLARGVPAESFRLLDPEYYLEKIPVKMDFAELLVSACLAIVMSALAAFIPARQAGKVSPLEVMRKV